MVNYSNHISMFPNKISKFVNFPPLLTVARFLFIFSMTGPHPPFSIQIPNGVTNRDR